jgi:hypothetical protein
VPQTPGFSQSQFHQGRSGLDHIEGRAELVLKEPRGLPALEARQQGIGSAQAPAQRIAEEQWQARHHGSRMSTKHSQLAGALGLAVDPAWLGRILRAKAAWRSDGVAEDEVAGDVHEA